MSIIIKIIKDTINVNLDSIENFHLPKFKLYLKIVSLSYYVKTTNILVTSSLVKKVLKNTHIFNDIILVSKLWIIKAISNSDSAIIWINVWDLQSSSKAKTIINHSFIVRQYIVIIQSTNISSGIS